MEIKIRHKLSGQTGRIKRIYGEEVASCIMDEYSEYAPGQSTNIAICLIENLEIITNIINERLE